jgi:hypothetical protein
VAFPNELLQSVRMWLSPQGASMPLCRMPEAFTGRRQS